MFSGYAFDAFSSANWKFYPIEKVFDIATFPIFKSEAAQIEMIETTDITQKIICWVDLKEILGKALHFLMFSYIFQILETTNAAVFLRFQFYQNH